MTIGNTLFHKTADSIEDAIQQSNLHNIATVGGVSTAAGFGLGGLLGARYLFGRPKPNLRRALGQTVLSNLLRSTSSRRTRKNARSKNALKTAGEEKCALTARYPRRRCFPGMITAGKPSNRNATPEPKPVHELIRAEQDQRPIANSPL